MADKICSKERETSLYLTQIRYLDEQLERCQLKCDELEKQNKDLASKYIALEKDKKDISEYLKHCVAAKGKKVDELAEQLENQQQAIEQDRKVLKLQHSQQMQELQEQVNELNSVRMMQAAKSEEQKEQLMQLMQQLSNMESLEKQLASQKREHEAAICRLMMEAELEREKMIKEMKTKTSNIGEEERSQHIKELEKVQLLLAENMDLWVEKRALQDSKSDLCFEMDNLKKDLNKNTLESFTSKKEVKQLKKNCQQLEAELKDCSITQEHMLAKAEDLRQDLASVSEECRQKRAEAGRLGAEIQRESSRRRQLEGVMQEAVIILRHILMDSERASDTQCKMQRLLEILESTTPMETGSAFKDSTVESRRGQKPKTTEPKPARAETLNIATDPLFLLVRYRPGDLGLVPRPTWKQCIQNLY